MVQWKNFGPEKWRYLSDKGTGKDNAISQVAVSDETIKRGKLDMEKRGLSQEGLKLIACVTMLIDHIGAVLMPHNLVLRMIGRIAFPIYCFLLAEGVFYTKNPRRYVLRLGIGAVLSELPFDLAFSGQVDWLNQSVMVTLLLGALALLCIKKIDRIWGKLLVLLPFAVCGELLCADYGGAGVLLIAVFALTRGKPWWQTFLGVLAVLYVTPSVAVRLWGIRVPMELLGALAMVPIACYSGRKATGGKAVQWAFYLFYPVHLTALFLLK